MTDQNTTHDSQNMAKYTKHDKHVVEGQGCPCKPMMGIHRCEWVQLTIVRGQGTKRSQEASLMVVVDRGCTPEQPKDNQKQDLAMRDKGG